MQYENMIVSKLEKKVSSLILISHKKKNYLNVSTKVHYHLDFSGFYASIFTKKFYLDFKEIILY
jgi:hypothetical protein